jgi:hypothetical protein
MWSNSLKIHKYKLPLVWMCSCLIGWYTQKLWGSNSSSRRMCPDVGSNCVCKLISIYLCAFVGNIVVHTGKPFGKLSVSLRSIKWSRSYGGSVRGWNVDETVPEACPFWTLAVAV